jgi:hypothetical protein
MTKCIYCLAEKPGTKAHVIPEALGGTLTFQDVCAQCNSQQGDSFEGKTVNSVLFSLARYALDIRGKQRQAPNSLARSYEAQAGLKVRLDDQLAPHVIPVLTVSDAGNGKVEIAGTYDVSDKARLVDDIAKVLQRKGLEKDPAQSKRRAQELIEGQSVPVSTDKSALKASFSIELASLRLLYLKIAYEVAYIELGPDYLADKAATAIRNAINSRDIAPKIRGQLPIKDQSVGSILANRSHHYVMFINNAAYVSLFGFAGSFQFSESSAFVLADERSVIFDFDPVARTFQKATLPEYLLASIRNTGKS